MEIRLNSENACYHSVKSLLAFRLVSKNIGIKTYKTIILPVVPYGCETWFLTIRDELGLRVLENRVPRIIFGPKREELTGDWRRLHNEELYNLYILPITIIIIIIIIIIRCTGHI
jgi:hypothetical protein